MRKLKDFPEHSNAQALSDFLEIQSIQNQVRESASGFGVWVRDDSQLEDAQTLLITFDPKNAVNTGAARVIRQERIKEQRPVFARTISRSTRRNSSWGLGVVLLIGLSLIVALVSKLGSIRMYPLMIVAIDPLSLRYQPVVDFREAWRLVTPIFIHFGLFHLGFNMMWLRRFGSQVEELHGTLRLLALVVVSAACGNAAQLYMGGPNFGGMSGVNYGLFGFVWMQTRYAPKRQYSLVSSETWMLMVWLVLCATGLMGPVANAAHAMGLVIGLLAGVPTYLRFRRTYKTAPQIKASQSGLQGWKKFERYYVEPYLPGWFLGVAFLVLLISR